MIYLDNNATTPLDPRVLDEMMLDFGHEPYNPSSPHACGRKGKALLSRARETIAECFGCAPSELIFTSGGSESITTAIQGLYRSGRILTSHIEHSCILSTVESLFVDYVPVDSHGAPTPEAIEQAITSETSLLVFSAVNGETGVMLDLQAVSEIAQRHRLPLIIDGVALLGRAPLTLHPGITAMAFSSHKIHGPKGCGLLYLKRGNRLTPLIKGGGQESNMRAGTENLAGILGFAKAITLATDFDHLYELQTHFETTLLELGAHINGQGPRTPNVSNIYFPGADGETLLMQLDQKGICTSHGSACSSGTLQLSHVLTAMGYPSMRIQSSLRFSFSRMNTLEEIDQALTHIATLWHAHCVL